MTRHDSHYAGGAWPRYLLLGSVVALCLSGIVMIFSASSISAYVKEGASYLFAAKQVAFALVGGFFAWRLSRFDYRRMNEFARPIWITSIVLLIATYLIGVVRGGARRWIPLGIFNLQPSELAKVAVVLIVGLLVLDWQRGRLGDIEFLKKLGIFAGAPAALILFQPDLGTTLSLVVAVLMVLFLGGVPMKWVYTAMGGVVVMGVVAIAIEPFRVKRLFGFLDPWADPQGKGYQIVQALLAFGTGGVDGVGLGLSRQKFFYLPEAHTDFIFAIIGEELGLLGALCFVAGFVVLLFAGVRIALGSRDPYGRLVAGGLTGMLAFQAILNMGAVTGILPVTGKPLPFVSYGGSSVLVTMIAIGLILSVSEYGGLAPRAVRTRPVTKEKSDARGDERRRDGRTHLPGPVGSRRVRRRA